MVSCVSMRFYTFTCVFMHLVCAFFMRFVCDLYAVWMLFLCGLYVVYMWFVSGLYVVYMWLVCGLFVVCMWCMWLHVVAIQFRGFYAFLYVVFNVIVIWLCVV